MGTGSDLLANGMNSSWTTILDGLPTVGGNNVWTGTNTFDGSVTVNAALIVNDPATFNASVVINNPATFNASVDFNASVTVDSTVLAYAVNGIGYIAPGVNGVVGNGTTDDTAAIQTILNTYDNILIGVGRYLIGKGLSTTAALTITIGDRSRRIVGMGAQLTNDSGANLGNGSFFLVDPTFTGTVAISLSSVAGNAAVYDIGGFCITNHTAGSGATRGMQLNAPGGDNNNCIHDVQVNGFALNYYVVNSRSIEWLRCAAWDLDYVGGSTSGECGWFLTISGTGNDTGDMTFIDCLSSSSTSGTGVAFNDQGNVGTFGGIRFTGFDFYGAANKVSMNMSGVGSSCGDIWFIAGTQFEGNGSDIAINMAASGSGTTIEDIHIDGLYFVGSGFSTAIKGAVASGGKFQFIFINNNLFSVNTAPMIDIRGTGGTCHGVSINGNQFRGNNTTGTTVYLENVTNATVCNNTAYELIATATNFIQFNTGGDYHVAIGNNAGGTATNSVADASGAAHSLITPNL